MRHVGRASFDVHILVVRTEGRPLCLIGMTCSSLVVGKPRFRICRSEETIVYYMS